jgi:hypothetical protein
VVGAKRRPPDRLQLLAPHRGAISVSTCTGGLRFAPTTGYFLTALRADCVRETEPRCTSNSNPLHVLNQEPTSRWVSAAPLWTHGPTRYRVVVLTSDAAVLIFLTSAEKLAKYLKRKMMDDEKKFVRMAPTVAVKN